MNTLADVIKKTTDRVRDYGDRRVRLTESDTIRVLVLPVLEALGWDLQDVEEVRSEYRHASADNPVDYALFLHGTPTLFVEAKALGVSLGDRKPLLQTLNYANAAGVDWCVLTNGAEWRVDRGVERILDTITEVDAFMARIDGNPDPGAAHPAPADPLPSALVNGSLPAGIGPTPRLRLMKTAEMVDAGLLPIGTLLTIKDRPDSAAKVVDGKRVEFRGELISFNDWGCRATGWTAIQIYKWAVLPDGRLLEALREGGE